MNLAFSRMRFENRLQGFGAVAAIGGFQRRGGFLLVRPRDRYVLPCVVVSKVSVIVSEPPQAAQVLGCPWRV
jgi:hypothetical protein